MKVTHLYFDEFQWGKYSHVGELMMHFDDDDGLIWYTWITLWIGAITETSGTYEDISDWTGFIQACVLLPSNGVLYINAIGLFLIDTLVG